MLQKLWDAVPPSIVCFLVALPLCLGIALASGVPAEKGLLTGIIGGIIVGMIQGAPLQVSGPAAGLTVVVWDIVQTHGLEKLGHVVLLAGAIQAAGALIKLGRWFRAVPPAVVQGLLAGIGVLIFGSQFHVMIDDKPGKNGVLNLLTIPRAIGKVFSSTSDLPHFEAACLGVGTIVLLLAWNRLKIRTIPGALIGVGVTTAVASIWSLPVARVPLPDTLFPHSLTFGFDAALLGSALLLATIATAETMLCAAAVDRLHNGPRTNFDREMLAQGAGNMLCGLAGALPMTGVIARSSANVGAGAKTRWSAVLHGVWLLVFVLVAPGLLRLVPVASLAGVLVFTGFKLIDIKAIKQLRQYGWIQVVIYVVTVSTIVAVNLLTGVIVGLILAMLETLRSLSQLQVHVEEEPGVTVLHLRGPLTFLRVPDVAEACERVPLNRPLRVTIEDAKQVDHAMVELLKTTETQRLARGGDITIDWNGHSPESPTPAGGSDPAVARG